MNGIEKLTKLTKQNAHQWPGISITCPYGAGKSSWVEFILMGKKESKKKGEGGGGGKNQVKKTTNQKVLHWNIMYRKKQQA